MRQSEPSPDGHRSWVIKAQLEEGTVLTAEEVARPKYNRCCAVDLVAGKLGSSGTTKSETVGQFFRAVSTMRGSQLVKQLWFWLHVVES